MIPADDNQIISDVIKREGGLSNNPHDVGGLTFEGISSKSNPDLFQNGHMPTDAEVRQRYEDKYIKATGLDKVTNYKLKSLLVDYSIVSGPGIAIQALQRVLGVPTDGILGPATIQVINQQPAEQLVKWMVAERVKMIGRLISKNPSQAVFAAGWINRAVEWLS